MHKLTSEWHAVIISGMVLILILVPLIIKLLPKKKDLKNIVKSERNQTQIEFAKINKKTRTSVGGNPTGSANTYIIASSKPEEENKETR